MSKFSRELYDLMEKSFMEENDPIQLSFTNRIYRKYGREFNKKYDYISGKNNDYIAEKLKNTEVTQLSRIANATESGVLSSIPNIQNDILNSTNENYLPPQMYVPEEIRKEWVALDTKKYFLNDENKRELLEEYLSTLSEVNRRKAIAVMCENSNSKNYYRFLDLSTTAYTPNQQILSNDLIRYFENKYLNEFMDRQETMHHYNHNVFSKQDMYEKKQTTDDVYKETVMNRNYYNPYDKKEMLEPKISQNRQFLDNQKQQDELFDIIDKNSSYYLKQQTEFNNEHLDVRNIRRNKAVDNSINNTTSVNYRNNDVDNKPVFIDDVNVDNSTTLSKRINKELEALNQSFIVEIPKVDNIADFIQKREILNYQNTLRKQHNISKALDLNNELANTNFVYRADIKAPAYQNREENIKTNVNNQMDSIYNTKLNENMNSNQSVMQIAKNDVEDQKNIIEKQDVISSINNNQYNNNKPNNIKMIRLVAYDDCNMNQLDPNSYEKSKFEQVKNNAFDQNIKPVSPNTEYLQNRFTSTKAYNNDDQNTYSKPNIVIGSARVAEMNRIQDFFNTKPTVVKTTNKKQNDNFEISEELPKTTRKAQGRVSSKKQQQRSNKNEIAVKTIKINRTIPIKQTKQKEAPINKEAKKVLV